MDVFGSNRAPKISLDLCLIYRWILIAAMPPPVNWLYRWAVPSKTTLIDEDCNCNFRTWQPAKPRMDQKMMHHLQNESLEIGLKETFTEDGWVSRKYVLSSMLLDCYLFTPTAWDFDFQEGWWSNRHSTFGWSCWFPFYIATMCSCSHWTALNGWQHFVSQAHAFQRKGCRLSWLLPQGSKVPWKVHSLGFGK